jgi:integrase
MGLAGLGQAETAPISRADIDFERGEINTFRHKTAQGFTVPIYPQVRPLLARLCAGLNHSDRVFKIRDAKKALRGACDRLKLPAFSQRSLRRVFVTSALQRGVDVKTIAQWQAHKDGGKLILNTYSHLFDDHSQRMAKLMTHEGSQASMAITNGGGKK